MMMNEKGNARGKDTSLAYAKGLELQEDKCGQRGCHKSESLKSGCQKRDHLSLLT